MLIFIIKMYMGNNVKSKKLFIRKLFLHYKPTLSKSKQIDLLKDWIRSCVKSEEYEMASVLKEELRKTENGPEQKVDSELKVVPINDLLKKTNKNDEPLIPLELPESYSSKKFKWINLWDEEPDGMVFVTLKISIKRRMFKIILLNYGIGFNI